jgi:hypothetical protein
VAAAFADAFAKDPVFTFLRPGRLRPQARLRRMFAVELELYVLRNGGTVWTTSEYDGAVAVLAPGASEMPKSMTGREALQWVRAFRTRLPRATRAQRAMEKRHPREPHFYIRTIGVRMALQGRGLGSVLMQPTLGKPTRPGCRRTSRPAPNAAQRSTSGSAFGTSERSNSQTTGRQCGRC